MAQKKKNYSVYYDSKCILCQKYILEIEKSFSSIKGNNLNLYDLRKKENLEKLFQLGKTKNISINPEDGIVFTVNNQIFQGENALNQIHNLNPNKSFIIKILSRIGISQLGYKIIKIIRKILLYIKGIEKLQ